MWLRSKIAPLEPYLSDSLGLMLRFFLVAALAIFLIYTFLAIRFPYPLDYGEAPLLDQARRLAAGQNIYSPDFSGPPYTVANYPPLYLLALLPFTHGSEMAFAGGRAISTLSALLVALFLGLTSYTFSRDRLAATVAGIFFLATPYTVHWAGLQRIDLLALATATAALFVLARWPRPRWSLLLAGCLLVAAAYTRQSYALAAPLAAVSWLWYQEAPGWRRAGQLTLLLAGLGLGLFLLLTWLTGGGFFLHVVTANANPFGFDRLWHNVKELAGLAPISLLLGALLLLAGRRRVAGWPLLAFFLLGAALSALTIGKIGSNVNYFLELSAALSLAAGALLAWSRPYPWRHVALLALLVWQAGGLMQHTMERTVPEVLVSRRSNVASIRGLENTIVASQGEVPADEYMGLLTMQGRPLYLQPFEMTQLANAGIWDQTPFLQALRQGQFPLVMIHYFPFAPVYRERWTPQMLEAVAAAYYPFQFEAGSALYRPYTGERQGPLPAALPPALFQPQLQAGPRQRLNSTPGVRQPDIAANPQNPRQLAATGTIPTGSHCQPPDCQEALRLYTSSDGGQSWQEEEPFTPGPGGSSDGQALFTADGRLTVLGLRGGAITLNQAAGNDNLQVNRFGQEEITRAGMFARPRLLVEPASGDLLLAFDSQFRDQTYVAPSFIRSSGGEQGNLTWSATARAGQSVAIADIRQAQAWPLDNIQLLLGPGEQMALVWTWREEPFAWPLGVWLALSGDGGQTFAPPVHLADTWGPISTASYQGTGYLLYRGGQAESQQWLLARSPDGGQSWQSSVASGDLALSAGFDKGAALSLAPDGTIDVLFYAGHGEAGCAPDVAGWRAGQPDTCQYDVLYSYSRDQGRSFSRPLALNESPILGERFMPAPPQATASAYLAIASGNEAAFPLWIDTGRPGGDLVTMRLSR